MDLCQIDDDDKLFISPAIEEWSPLEARRIEVIIDLDGGLDTRIPTAPEHCLYLYFPIYDDDQQRPPVSKLRAIARMAATLMREGHGRAVALRDGLQPVGVVAGLILVRGVPRIAARQLDLTRMPSHTGMDSAGT
jgi:hypothetical protein